MRQTLFALGVLLVLVLSTTDSVFAQEELQVNVELNRDTIGLDEQAVLTVTVSGATQNLPAPKMPTLPMFEVYSQGRSSNYSIINGRVEASVTHRFLILPQKPGTYPIESIAAVHQNKRYRGNAVTLTVLDQGTAPEQERLERETDQGNGSKKDYYLEAEVDNANPYVSEQVTLTLRFLIAVRTYGSIDLENPSLTGFWAEDMGNKAPYYQKLEGRTYRVYERQYALYPTHTGELTIGRATIKTTVAGESSRRDPFDVFGGMGMRGQEVTVRSKPIVLQVKSLPEKGKPTDFTGTVGRFTITATPSKRTVEANQPVTLRIQIRGTGNIKSVAEPLIPELPEFRTYRASSNESTSQLGSKIGGVKTFEEVFIPRQPGDLTIPALSFNYFDPEDGRYRTISTDPISLTVTKPEGYVATADLPYTAPDAAIGAEAREIRYIMSEPGEFSRQDEPVFFSPLYLLVNGLPVLLLAGTVVARVRKERLSSDVSYARSRAASRMAKKRLAKARSLQSVKSASEFYAECGLAVLSFVADKLNISPHGLTIGQLAELLAERGAERELIESITGFLKSCDFGRFAPAQATEPGLAEALAEAERLIVALEAHRW